jgi:membrane-associated phospholipid phosphatase
MTCFLRRWLDELVTVCFLLLVFGLVPFFPPEFATPGGRALAVWVLRTVFPLFGLLLVTAYFVPRARRALRVLLEFAPILVGVLAYVSLKLMHASAITAWLGIPAKDHFMLAADNLLFGKTLYLWLAQFPLFVARPFLQIMSICYSLYPFTPLLVVGWFLYCEDIAQVRLVRRTMILSLYGGYCCYLLIPVSGPLSIMQQPAPLFIQSTLTYNYLMGNFRYVYDCFPSLHTANPWLLLWLCRNRFPRWFVVVGALICFGITFSTIALRMHYGIDDIAGIVWACLIACLVHATLPHASPVCASADPLPQPAQL